MFKEIINDLIFQDKISFLLFDYNINYDLGKIHFSNLIKNLDQKIIESKGVTEKNVLNAFMKNIEGAFHIFNHELQKEFLYKLYKIKRVDDDYSDKKSNHLKNIHFHCINSNDEIIKWGFMKLRYKYSSFYKENLDVDKFELFLKESNLIFLNKFTIGRYFNALEYYLKYSYKNYKNNDLRKSVWSVKKK